MVGIYILTNTANGKVYIGQSVDIERRIYTHFSFAFNQNYSLSHNYHLHNAIRKYGKDSFVSRVLEGGSGGNISKVLHGDLKTAYGYKWEYSN